LTAPQAFFRTDPRFRTPARAEAVKVGRRSAIEAHFDVSRPRVDRFEHGGRLDDYGPEERSVGDFATKNIIPAELARLPAIKPA
jgi:hypothetical protein